jgi:DNA-binding transcriptional regulator YhcF (GntR family)
VTLSFDSVNAVEDRNPAAVPQAFAKVMQNMVDGSKEYPSLNELASEIEVNDNKGKSTASRSYTLVRK